MLSVPRIHGAAPLQGIHCCLRNNHEEQTVRIMAFFEKQI
jgi:hypothetical protein